MERETPRDASACPGLVQPHSSLGQGGAPLPEDARMHPVLPTGIYSLGLNSISLGGINVIILV